MILFFYNIKKILFFSLMFFIFCCINICYADSNKNKELDLRLTKQQIQEKIDQNKEERLIQKNIDTSNQDIDSLADDELLIYQLNTALFNQDIQKIKQLLPIYENIDNPDKILIYFAKAFLAQKDDNFNLAISYYQAILKEKPELTPVRVYMLVPLIQDRRYHDAKKQIAYIKNTQNLPNDILELITDYQHIINKRQSVKTNFSIRYLSDGNINSAPKNDRWRNWQLPSAKKDQGIGANLYATKNHSLAGHWASKSSLSVYSKTYDDHQEYNDLIMRASSGIALQDAKKEVAVMPFLEKRFYGNHSYWQSTGLRVQATTSFSKKTDGFFALQYTKTRHDHRQFLDGNTINASLTGAYRINDFCHSTLGADYAIKSANDPTEDYQRWSIRNTLDCQNKSMGIETGLIFGQKQYKTKDIFGIRRQDDEYNAWLSLYSPKLHWQGFAPKLTASYQHISSNHFLGKIKDNQQIFFEIEKKF